MSALTDTINMYAEKITKNAVIDPCNNELATSKLLTKNYSSVSLNNVQQGQLNNKQDELVLTDWDSNDNLLSIL